MYMIPSNAQLWHFYVDRYPWPLPFLQEALGNIPHMIDVTDERPLDVQINERYRGGWDVMLGFTLIDGSALKFPGDPLVDPFARLDVRDERLYVYPYGWVCIVHGDRTYEVARIT